MIKAGACMVCDKDLRTSCGHCNSKKLTDQYTEVEVEWTNGAKMKIAMCVPCALKNAHAVPENKTKIANAHHDHWAEMGALSDRMVTLV